MYNLSLECVRVFVVCTCVHINAQSMACDYVTSGRSVDVARATSSKQSKEHHHHHQSPKTRRRRRHRHILRASCQLPPSRDRVCCVVFFLVFRLFFIFIKIARWYIFFSLCVSAPPLSVVGILCTLEQIIASPNIENTHTNQTHHIMDVYTSDSSDSDSRELRTLNFARLDLTPFALDATLLQQLAPPPGSGHHQHQHQQHHRQLQHHQQHEHNQLMPTSSASSSQHPHHLHSNGNSSSSHANDIETLLLAHNRLNIVPVALVRFNNLRVLDLSANGLTELPDFLSALPLTSLIAKNNALSDGSLPKTLVSRAGVLRELNLSGNRFERFPEQILELRGLKYLYLGGNKIDAIPMDVWKVQR